MNTIKLKNLHIKHVIDMTRCSNCKRNILEEEPREFIPILCEGECISHFVKCCDCIDTKKTIQLSIMFKMVVDHMKTQLTTELLQKLKSILIAINQKCTGDGAGLSGGILSDMAMNEFMTRHIHDFVEDHSDESDCKILGHSISMKKINGKSTIALDWSKNGEDSKQRERFKTDIMIVNLKTEQWWKTKPMHATPDEISFFSKTVKAGIYFVSHEYCKKNVVLSSNNKTNSLIDQTQLYRMMMESISKNNYIEFPTEFQSCTFNLLDAFSFSFI